ncbi:MAG: ABC transporter ATP-binding protein/permease [Proteobacteria bacterium]|nr:ABC transporter ATP-binding protein/permease [Pseudomonadota bacterium]MBU1712650.1 ABC transporter ATP-binding protein/permease [Pseudomonadota bacterium]
MRFDYGYEEEKLGKQYDLNLLKKLYLFGKPYSLLFFSSIVLVILITLLDLSIPYVTKIAIDRYIVPRSVYHVENAPAQKNKTGYYRADLSDPAVRETLEKHKIQFKTEGSFALVPLDELSKMDKPEIDILREKDFKGVGLAAAVLLAIVIAGFCLNFLDTMLMEYAGQMIMHDLRMRLFTHIQSLPAAFFSHNPTGRLVTRVTSDVQNMDEFFTSVIAVVFKDIFLLAGIMIVLLGINWKLALVSFTVLPFVLFISFRFSSQARDAFRTLRIKVAEINSKISETIGGIRVIQLFLQEKENIRSFKKLNHENYIAGMKQIQVLAVFMPVIELLGSVSVALVIYYGGSSVLSEKVTIGALVAFISYMKMFFRPIRDIADKYNILQNAMSSAERIFLILDNREGQPESSGKLSGGHYLDIIESVEFRNISFSYIPGEPVLRDISFMIEAGRKIAVVGPTGTGKTTLLNLLTRFYEPDSGSILINGKDIKTFPLDLLRSKMAIVMQDSFLFSGTVGENIARGKSSISKEEVENILDVLNCRHIIERLPYGIDTVLSEGGKSISSGERQLISIARAFARNPGIIMLDEATSYVDSETERRIEEALTKLMEGRTSIIIAHRLTTAHRADRIIVFNKGRLIESGSHEELMKKTGFYYRLNTL